MIFAQCSECQRGENLKHARENGSHVGLKPVLFVTQPKLRTMCLHVLRQSPECQVINVTITVVPVSLLSSDQYVLCVQCVSMGELCCVLCCGLVYVCVGVLVSVLCMFVCVFVFGVCLRVQIQNASVCRFKTPPCVPAKRPCLM